MPQPWPRSSWSSGAAGAGGTLSPARISIWYSGSSLPIPNGPLSSVWLSLVKSS